VDKAGKTTEFLFRAKCDKVAARRFFEKSIAQNGVPETVTIGNCEIARLTELDNFLLLPRILLAAQQHAIGPRSNCMCVAVNLSL
jgi:hypothetical protein